MKLLGTLGLLSVTYALCAAPALGHGGFHHGRGCHGWEGCWGYGCEGCGQWEARPATHSQTFPRSPGYAPAEPAASFETLEGKIAEVIYLPGVSPSAGIVEVLVAAGEQQTLARLAPAGFLQQHKILLKEGENISLTGYRVRTAEGDVIVATELRTDGQTLTLRNPRGRTSW